MYLQKFLANTGCQSDKYSVYMQYEFFIIQKMFYNIFSFTNLTVCNIPVALQFT